MSYASDHPTWIGDEHPDLDALSIEDWITYQRYIAARDIDTPEGRVTAAVAPLIFTHRLIVGDRRNIGRVYCYHDPIIALCALAMFEPGVEPIGWHRAPGGKHGPTRRRDANGDPATERVDDDR